MSQQHVSPFVGARAGRKLQAYRRNLLMSDIHTSFVCGKHANKTIAYSCIDCPFTTSAGAE